MSDRRGHGRRGWEVAVGEGVATLLGFAATLMVARGCGATAFGRYETATALAAWWLILVRGGVDAAIVRAGAISPNELRALGIELRRVRSAWALVGWSAVVALGAIGGDVGFAAVMGASLWIATLAPDLEARALGETGVIGAASAAKGAAVLGWIALCAGWGIDDLRLAAAPAWGEAAAALVFATRSPRERPIGREPRSIGSSVFDWSHAAATATVWRFSRVALLSVDLLILGSFGAATGPFAAARRACLAILGIALAIASAASGPLAGAGAVGVEECRRRRNDAARLLAWFVVPTSLGLALTGSRWISLAFGDAFDVPAWLMIALAARIPAAVFGALSQTTAFALGEERTVARVAVAAVIAAGPAAGVGFAIAGATGASAALVLVEIGSWFVVESRLVARGVGIDASSFPIEPAGGAAGLMIGCAATIGASAPAATIAGAAGFVTGAGFARLAARSRRPARPTCRVIAEASRHGS